MAMTRRIDEKNEWGQERGLVVSKDDCPEGGCMFKKISYELSSSKQIQEITPLTKCKVWFHFDDSCDPSDLEINPIDKYTVKKGDTLWALARRFQTDIATLKKLNNIQDGEETLLQIGRILELPKPLKELAILSKDRNGTRLKQSPSGQFDLQRNQTLYIPHERPFHLYADNSSRGLDLDPFIEPYHLEKANRSESMTEVFYTHDADKNLSKWNENSPDVTYSDIVHKEAEEEMVMAPFEEDFLKSFIQSSLKYRINDIPEEKSVISIKLGEDETYLITSKNRDNSTSYHGNGSFTKPIDEDLVIYLMDKERTITSKEIQMNKLYKAIQDWSISVLVDEGSQGIKKAISFGINYLKISKEQLKTIAQPGSGPVPASFPVDDIALVKIFPLGKNEKIIQFLGKKQLVYTLRGIREFLTGAGRPAKFNFQRAVIAASGAKESMRDVVKHFAKTAKTGAVIGGVIAVGLNTLKYFGDGTIDDDDWHDFAQDTAVDFAGVAITSVAIAGLALLTGGAALFVLGAAVSVGYGVWDPLKAFRPDPEKEQQERPEQTTDEQ